MYRKVAIRSVRPEDEVRLFALATELFGETPGFRPERTLAVLETDAVFVAEAGRDTAGYAAVEQAGDAVRIDHLLVSEVHCGEQVEAQLLEFAEGYAISVGARALQVVVEPENRRAVDFYRSRGFVPAGEGLLELLLPSLP